VHLKRCADIWKGNCGVDKDFCVDQSTGSPGTSKGQNGCVASCGMAITNNRVAPKEFRNIGYFESWNRERKCLHMDVDDIPKLDIKYTHIHFAFADITPDYQVSVAKVQDQFDKFRRARGYKRILVFGGWAFSTESKTYSIFRDGVRPGNRERLAANLANFILKHDLDGIDFDWVRGRLYKTLTRSHFIC
jgi:chitinase